MTVEAGTVLTAAEVEGDWVGVVVEKGDQRIEGWIHAKHLGRVPAGAEDPRPGDTERPKPKPVPTPEAPGDPEAIVRKGGKFWKDCPEAAEEGRTVRPGDRFLIWPAEDRMFTVKAFRMMVPADIGTIEMYWGDLTTKFHWRVRPGKQAPGADEAEQLLAYYRFTPRDNPGRTSLTHGRIQLKKGVRTGEFEYQLTFMFLGGDGSLLFWLARPSGAPVSNLIELQLKAIVLPE